MGILCPWLSQEWRGITIATVVQLRVQAQGLVKGCFPVPAAPSVRAGAAGMTVGAAATGCCRPSFPCLAYSGCPGNGWQ